jgi:hypothetical protein
MDEVLSRLLALDLERSEAGSFQDVTVALVVLDGLVSDDR